MFGGNHGQEWSHHDGKLTNHNKPGLQQLGNLILNTSPPINGSRMHTVDVYIGREVDVLCNLTEVGLLCKGV